MTLACERKDDEKKGRKRSKNEKVFGKTRNYNMKSVKKKRRNCNTRDKKGHEDMR